MIARMDVKGSPEVPHSDVMSEEAAQYLHKTFSQSLSEGIAATIKSNPADEAGTRKALRASHVKEGALGEVAHEADPETQATADKRHRTPSDQEAFRALQEAEWVDEELMRDVLNHLRKTLNATGVYLAIYEDQAGLKDGELAPALRYLAADDSHLHMLDQCLMEDEGITWDLLREEESAEAPTEKSDSPEASEDEDEGVRRSNLPDIRAEFVKIPPESIVGQLGASFKLNTLFVEEVMNDPRIRFFGVTRPGSYAAVSIEFDNVASPASVATLCAWLEEKQNREQALISAQQSGEAAQGDNSLRLRAAFPFANSDLKPQCITDIFSEACGVLFKNQKRFLASFLKASLVSGVAACTYLSTRCMFMLWPGDAEEKDAATVLEGAFEENEDMLEAQENPVPPVQLPVTPAKYVLCVDFLGSETSSRLPTVLRLKDFAQELASALIRTQMITVERQVRQVQAQELLLEKAANEELAELLQNSAEKLEALQRVREAEALERLEAEEAEEARERELKGNRRDSSALGKDASQPGQEGNQQKGQDRLTDDVDVQERVKQFEEEDSSEEEQHALDEPLAPLRRDLVLEAARAHAALEVFKTEVLSTFKPSCSLCGPHVLSAKRL
ncbi:hypothetical protein ACSSS7_008208 [Eimeria intestinalis]